MEGDRDTVDLLLHEVEDTKIKEEVQEGMRTEEVETSVVILDLKSDVNLDMVTEIVATRENQQTQT